MKRVKINAWKKGLVLKNGEYQRVLSEGSYWIGFSEIVIEYDMAVQFKSPINLNIMLLDSEFVRLTEIVEVKNNEIALRYENGLLTEVMDAGTYVYWKGLLKQEFKIVDLNTIEIDSSIDKSLYARKELVNYIRTYTVEPYEKAVLYINGKFEKIVEPGTYYYWKNSTTVVITRADVRSTQLEIAGQEILSKDKAALRINFYVQYKIEDIVKAVVENKEYEKQLYVIMQLILREYIGALSLDELLEKKEAVSEYIMKAAAKRVKDLGVELRGGGIRDIILPGEMKEIMNQVLVAEKKAQANTIMRREETASTRSLLNTAKLMEDNAMLLKLKEMEFVEKVSEKITGITVSGESSVASQLRTLFGP
jgi:regulator of protease activity HflC (stomatin/prohibitin superfamily)